MTQRQQKLNDVLLLLMECFFKLYNKRADDDFKKLNAFAD